MQTQTQVPAEQKQHHKQQQKTHATARLVAPAQAVFEDARPQSAERQAMQLMMRASPMQQKLQILQAKMASGTLVQRMGEEGLLHGKSIPAQMMGGGVPVNAAGLEAKAGAMAVQLMQNKNSMQNLSYVFKGFSLQRKIMISLKDSGAAKRTTGSGSELTAQVDNAIAVKNMTNMRDTAAALSRSVANRRLAPVVGVEETPGGHDARIALEVGLLNRLNIAIAELEGEQGAASLAKEQVALANMPDLGLSRGPTGGAWGK